MSKYDDCYDFARKFLDDRGIEMNNVELGKFVDELFEFRQACAILDADKVCEWITSKVEEGRGAVMFCLEEHAGYIGVWIGDAKEGRTALGTGEDVIEAILMVMAHEDAQQGKPTNEE